MRLCFCTDSTQKKMMKHSVNYFKDGSLVVQNDKEVKTSKFMIEMNIFLKRFMELFIIRCMLQENNGLCHVDKRFCWYTQERLTRHMPLYYSKFFHICQVRNLFLWCMCVCGVSHLLHPAWLSVIFWCHYEVRKNNHAYSTVMSIRSNKLTVSIKHFWGENICEAKFNLMNSACHKINRFALAKSGVQGWEHVAHQPVFISVCPVYLVDELVLVFHTWLC